MEDLRRKLQVTGSNGRRKLRDVTHAVIHHTAMNVPKNIEGHLKGIAAYHVRKGWRRIGYHVAIAPDGTRYLLNDFEEKVWHAGNYEMNLKSIGVVLLGNLESNRPTPEAIASLWGYLDELTTRRPDMPKLLRDTIKTHSEVRYRPTACPGGIMKKVIHAYKG